MRLFLALETMKSVMNDTQIAALRGRITEFSAKKSGGR
ncbi:hypothetical protein F8B43_2425 [Methylorubrum populi]|uniref:Uncharacterized protein n=1 Tax=Methylorubrum populi TaxID=223967 RepID=A0A833MWJ8_9HYPH|nr:hypothetical protein F8B43_2425 [Methylorubrum populi]